MALATCQNGTNIRWCQILQKQHQELYAHCTFMKTADGIYAITGRYEEFKQVQELLCSYM